MSRDPISIINLPGDITEVADEIESGDELLSVYDLDALGRVQPFAGMRPGPVNFPGSMILRRCSKGRVLCRQGEAGATAFQILTRENAVNLLKALLDSMSAEEKAFEKSLAEAEGETDPERQQLKNRQDVLLRRNRTRRPLLEQEIAKLEHTLTSVTGGEKQPPRQVAYARLLVSSGKKQRGLLHRLLDTLRGRRSDRQSARSVPRYIPNDGPQDLNVSTLSAPMFEGDLFGEMSCMNLAPRSATVISSEGSAEDPVYVVEMLRNALDALRGNAEYRALMDQTYRSRVMETQVRSLPLFGTLTDSEYKWLADKLELVEFKAGDVIFDEHDSVVDACYVVRTGVVKVSQNLGCLLGENDLLECALVCRELAACKNGSAAARQFWGELSADVRLLAERYENTASVSGGAVPGDQDRQTLRNEINKWIQTSSLSSAMGRTTEELVERTGLTQYSVLFEEFQEKTQEWWELEVRIFNRVFLESVCRNGIRRRASVIHSQRTLAYAGRGEIIGEIAVLRKEARSATCLAFTHPSSGQKAATQSNLIPQRVEAVRIGADVLQELCVRSPDFKQYVDDVVNARRERDQLASRQSEYTPAGSQTKEFDALGLAWGQSLMVIDLDRCTRCQECVKACVDAHEDGRTRLYLDGPRFQNKYLIPVTCRKCLDPVCMIGCPVGAINRGSTGEIQIADHCIGCSKCADQCPYGSIQMDLLDTVHELSPDLDDLLGPGFALKTVHEKAVVCDQCSSTPSGQPSCVYACPHDAAFRVEGLRHFNQ